MSGGGLGEDALLRQQRLSAANKKWHSSADVRTTPSNKSKFSGLLQRAGSEDVLDAKDCNMELVRSGIEWIVVVTAKIGTAVERLGTPEDTDELREELAQQSMALVHERALTTLDRIKYWTDNMDSADSPAPDEIVGALRNFVSCVESFRKMQATYVQGETVYVGQATSLLVLQASDPSFEPTTCEGKLMTQGWLNKRASAISDTKDLQQDVHIILSEAQSLIAATERKIGGHVTRPSSQPASLLAASDGDMEASVLYDFTSEHEREISCKAGMSLSIAKSQEPLHNGWTWCLRADGSRGLVPTGYLSEHRRAPKRSVSHGNNGLASSLPLGSPPLGSPPAVDATRKRSRSAGKTDSIESPTSRGRWLRALSERSKIPKASSILNLKFSTSPRGFRNMSSELRSDSDTRESFDEDSASGDGGGGGSSTLGGEEFVEVREGHVIFTLRNGHVYDGEWKDQRRVGFGKYSMPDKKRVYQGMFVNDEPSRTGLLSEQGLGEYTGEVKVSFYRFRKTPTMRPYDVLKQGKGEMRYKTGDSYVGDWQNDKRHGYGIQLWRNGASYYGQWNKDAFHGVGLYIHADGAFFSGTWNNGVKDGKGSLKTPTGHCVSGVWKEDALMKGTHSVRPISKAPTVSTRMASEAIGAKQSSDFSTLCADVSRWADTMNYDDGVIFAPESLLGVRALLQDLASPFSAAITRFEAYMESAYGVAGTLSSAPRGRHAPKAVIARCQDDMRSFLAFLCEHVSSLEDAPVESPAIGTPGMDFPGDTDQTLPETVAGVVFPCVYNTVFALLLLQNKDADAILEDKLAVFSSATLTDLGVKFTGHSSPVKNKPCGPTLCSNDETERAVVFCRTCRASLCLLCADVLHKPSSKRAHVREPINASSPKTHSERRRRRVAPAPNAIIEEEEGEDEDDVAIVDVVPLVRDAVIEEEEDPMSSPVVTEQDTTVGSDDGSMAGDGLPPDDHIAVVTLPDTTVPIMPPDDASHAAVPQDVLGPTTPAVPCPVVPLASGSPIPEKDTSKPLYWEAIEVIRTLPAARSPREKGAILVETSNAIVRGVQELSPGSSVLMGAEDKFPIFLYVLIKARIPHLATEYQMLADFGTEEEIGLEAVFRITELEAALGYIRTLDWNVRDARGVLVPLSSLHDRVRGAARDLKREPSPPDMLWFAAVLRRIGARHLGDYSAEEIADTEVKRTAIKHSACLRRMVRTTGLVLSVNPVYTDGATGPEGTSPVGRRSRAQSMSRTSLELRHLDPTTCSVVITFELQYPLYVYRDMAVTVKREASAVL